MSTAERIDAEMSRVQANLRILTELLGHAPDRLEAFAAKIAARSLELDEALDPDEAEAELERRVAGSSNRIHALLNQCSFSAIRALDARLQSLVAEAGDE